RTGPVSSPTPRARPTGSRKSSSSTRRRRGSRASASTSKPWKRYSAAPPRCSSTRRAATTCSTCRSINLSNAARCRRRRTSRPQPLRRRARRARARARAIAIRVSEERTMGPRLNLLLILAVVAVIVIRMSVFTVDTREHALKFQVGRIAHAEYEPGLHFKIPFFENVARYPKTILNYDEGTEERFLTGEKKNVIVDYFVTWRIVDPSQYYRSVRGDKEQAEQRLAAIVKEGIKAAISQRTLQEVVSAERTELMEEMLVQVRERSPELGIEVVDARVKRINLSDEVSDSVYMRMSQERAAVATQWRAEGEEEYERVR